MINWTIEQEKEVKVILLEWGIDSLAMLLKSSLLIHIHYGGDVKGGQSLVVPIGRLKFNRDGIHFDYSNARIRVNFDDVKPNKKLGGALRNCGPDDSIEIESLVFDGKSWTVICWFGYRKAELYQENIQVLFIKPIKK